MEPDLPSTTSTGLVLDRNGLQVLDREQCVRLLQRATVGRVGITSGALPAVLPVNFHVDDDRIVFRTGQGTKLDAATRDAVVAFEADEIDPAGRTGWSVMVTGVAQEVTDAGERQRLVEHVSPRWVPGDDGRVVAITMELVSGRRILPR
jgi:nitroimidazol reductase NimA-like FMN-containing flavoprotein (pyridoxamine 5'-phosphate oxidase superfamily)